MQVQSNNGPIHTDFATRQGKFVIAYITFQTSVSFHLSDTYIDISYQGWGKPGSAEAIAQFAPVPKPTATVSPTGPSWDDIHSILEELDVQVEDPNMESEI